MALGDVYLLTVENEHRGVETVTSLHYREVQTSTDAFPWLTLMSTFIGEVQVLWQGAMSASVLISRIGCKRIYPTGSPTEYQYMSQAIGLISGAALPSNCPAVFNEKTGFADRSKRGRIFFGAVPEEKQSAGLLDPSYIGTELDALVTKLLEPLVAGPPSTGGWSLTVWSPTLAAVDPPAPPFDTLVTQIDVNTHTKNLRSRTSRAEALSTIVPAAVAAELQEQAARIDEILDAERDGIFTQTMAGTLQPRLQRAQEVTNSGS